MVQFSTKFGYHIEFFFFFLNFKNQNVTGNVIQLNKKNNKPMDQLHPRLKIGVLRVSVSILISNRDASGTGTTLGPDTVCLTYMKWRDDRMKESEIWVHLRTTGRYVRSWID